MADRRVACAVRGNSVFATIAAVECFVDRHCAEQIERFSSRDELVERWGTVEACRRDEAIAHLTARPGAQPNSCAAIVVHGSALAVVASRRS